MICRMELDVFWNNLSTSCNTLSLILLDEGPFFSGKFDLGQSKLALGKIYLSVLKNNWHY